MDSPSPYKAPEARDALPEEIAQSRPVAALLVGLLIFWLGRTLPSFSIPFLFMPDTQNAAARSQFLMIYGTLFGICRIVFSLLAGYVCARLVKRKEFRHASILFALTGAYTLMGWMSVSTNHDSVGYSLQLIANLLLVLLFIMLGTWLGWWRNRRIARKVSSLPAKTPG